MTIHLVLTDGPDDSCHCAMSNIDGPMVMDLEAGTVFPSTPSSRAALKIAQAMQKHSREHGSTFTIVAREMKQP